MLVDYGHTYFILVYKNKQVITYPKEVGGYASHAYTNRINAM